MPEGKTKRRWRRAAEAAIAPERLTAERDLLAAELARRLWAANGGSAGVSAEEEGSLVVLETLVTRYLEPGILRRAAGLKYLQQIEESLHGADYEDIPAMQAERLWVDGFLTETASAEASPSSWTEREMEAQGTGGLATSARARLELFYQELTRRVQGQLKAAEIAA